MSHKPNPRQLVLRRDTATGLTLVGWESDLPVGRFEHLGLICEPAEHILPDSRSKYYGAYQSALRQAREANCNLLEQQVRNNQSQGWYFIPFSLATDQKAMVADAFGNYATAALLLQYQLTQNRKQVWAVIQQGLIVHVRARYPKKALDDLTYHVWYHKQRYELVKIAGTLVEGSLIVCESGLWFCAEQD